MDSTTAGQAALQLLFVQHRARISPGSTRFLWPPNAHMLAGQMGLADALFADEAPDEYNRAFLKHTVKRLEQAIDGASDSDIAWLGIERGDLVCTH